MKLRKYWCGNAALAAASCLLAVAVAAGQGSALEPPGGDAFGGGEETPALSALSAEFTAPAGDRPGQLFVTAVVKPGWHIYSLTQGTGKQGGPLASKITLELPAGVKLAKDFQAAPPPKKGQEKDAYGDLVIETHEGTVTWRAPFTFAPGVDPAKVQIKGKLFALGCEKDSCHPPRDYEFTAALGKGVDLPASSREERQPAAQQPAAPPAAPQQPAPPPAQPTTETPAAAPAAGPAAASGQIAWRPFTTIAALQSLNSKFDPEQSRAYVLKQIPGTSGTDILLHIVFGFLGGLILNIMPCVLPVIGLKLLSFLEQAGHDRRKALLLNVWYSAGLVAVFVVLAALAILPQVLGWGQNLGWGQQFGIPAFTITMAAVLFVMALSFLGVWEVPIPGFAGRGKAAKLAAQEGALGAFSKGALTTVLATPCSAPLLFSAFTWASVQRPALAFAIFLSAGLGMASPYLLIGAFPQLLRFLPKPGAWMDTFKQIMGFVLLGTVVFIFTFLKTPLLVPTLGLLFGLWGACWWIGRISPLAETRTRVAAWLEAAAFAGLVWIFMFPGVSGIIPGSYSPGSLADVMQARFDEQAQLQAALVSRALVPQGLQSSGGNRTVFLDFTADWCLSCKAMQYKFIDTPAVANLVDTNRVVAIKVDCTPKVPPPDVMKMWKIMSPGVQVPTLVVIPAGHPNQPIVFGGGYTQQTVLDALLKAGPSQ